MEFTSALDYAIAVIGILIIAVSFAWNIYEVFFHKSKGGQKGPSDAHPSDSSIR